MKTRIVRHRLVALAALIVFLTAILSFPGEASATGLSLTYQGGAVGDTTNVLLQGDPGELYFTILSFNQGPTPFGGAVLSVGFDLLTLSAVLPGFTGGLAPGTGSATGFLPIPNNPTWAGITFYLQAITLPGVGQLVDDVSNPVTLDLAMGDSWETTITSMSAPRALHTLTVLDDGDAFVSGGGDALLSDPSGAAVDTCEIYDTETEVFSLLPNTMTTPRLFHTATKLLDGRVLLVGGVDDTLPNPVVLSSAEIFDPQAGTFTATPGGMSTPRAGHTATRLADGRVLITGGTSNGDDLLSILTNALNSAEIFDPGTGTFSSVPNMFEPKVGQAASRLPDGRVLVSSGITFVVIFIPIPLFSSGAQIFDPATNSWSGVISSNSQKALFAMTTLPDGRVLSTGGVGGSDPLNPVALANAEVFLPSSSTFQSLPSLANARTGHQQVLLPDGTLLVAGGAQGSLTTPLPIASCEIFDPATDTFAPAGSLVTPRGTHTAALLPNQRVLAVGGSDTSSTTTDTAETYQPLP